jgi:hypothetical protein
MAIKYSKKGYWLIPLIILLLVFISGCVQQGPFKPNFKSNLPEASSAYTPTGKGWVKVHDGLWAGNVELTSDGGFIVFGTTMNDAIKNPYGWVMPARYLFRIDANGSIMWGNTSMYARDAPTGAVSQTSDGGFVVADAIYKRKSGGVVLRGEIQKESGDEITDADVLLRRIASDGSIVWNKTFDVSGKDTDDAAWLVLQDLDGGYVIGGVIEGTGTYNLANGDIFLLKTDAQGNEIWTKTFEFEDNVLNRPLLLQQALDGGFLIFGETQGDFAANNERYAYFIKTDSEGNKLWEKIFKRDEIGRALRPLIEETPDGGYFVVGACVLKLDANGNTLEKKWYAELDEGSEDCSGQSIDSIQKTSDGGYIIANEGVYLIKLDAEGNKIWERQMTDQDSEILEPKAYQTADNGYIIIGNLNYGWHQIGGGYGSGDLGVGWTAVVVIKVDENGHLNQTIYPKPAQRLPSPAKRVTGKGWMKTFGGDFNSRANSVQQTSDGGYIATGWIGYGALYPSGRNDTIIIEHLVVYLVKTDANGNEVWNKSFGGPGMSMSACSNIDNIICTLNQNSSSVWLHGGFVGHSVQQTSDRGYIITGVYASGRLHNRTSPTDNRQVDYGTGAEVYLIKTDANGNMQWSKTFDGEYYQEIGYDVQQTLDGGFFIVGTTTSYGVCPYCAKELGQPAPEDVYLIKTDANGNIVWKKVFGGMHNDMAFSGQETSDGGFIVTGVTASLSGNGVEDVYLLKIDKDGNKTWEKTFGKKGRTEKGSSVQQTSDGGYIIVGQTVWGGAQWETESDVYLIKTDANGNEIWEKEFGGDLTDIGYSVEQTSDGGYIISGFTGSFEDLGATYLIKTDANGNKVWERIFEGISGLSERNSVQQTTDGGYIINAGNIHTHDISDGLTIGTGDDAYLIKTDENGDV